MQAQLAALQAQLHARDINDLIGGSGLSEAGQRVVSGAVTDLRADASLETVQALIERQREAEAALAERQAVKGVGPDVARGSGTQIGSMRNSLDKIALAVDGLIGGVDPGEGVKPLSGIRELYTLLTGDYEFTGLFQPERVEFANVTSATMAGLVADALNKRVVNQFQVYDRFWEPLVHVEDFTTLQSVKWITLGGVGELPTVAEGAAYSEMTWDDQTETSQWLKKGGYLGLTLEAIDKDDTRRLQQAPRALAQSAWMTLGKAFTSVFTGSRDHERRQDALPRRPQQPGIHGPGLSGLRGDTHGHGGADRTQLGRTAGRADHAALSDGAAWAGGHGLAGAGHRGRAGHGQQRREPVGQRGRPRCAHGGGSPAGDPQRLPDRHQ